MIACSESNQSIEVSNKSTNPFTLSIKALNDSTLVSIQIQPNTQIEYDLPIDIYTIEVDGIGKKPFFSSEQNRIVLDSMIHINGLAQAQFEAYEKFRKASLAKWINPIRKQASKEKDSRKIDSLRLIETKNYEIHLKELWEYSITKLDTSIVLAYASQRWRAFDSNKMQELEKDFQKRYPYSFAKDQLQANIETLERFSIGQTFSTKPFYNRKGELESIELKNKPTLIEFWASWCPPCRRDAKYIAQVAKNADWNVISINLDTREKNWLTAIEKDQRFWKQLNSPAGLNSENIKFYGIRALPYNFILDEQGKISHINIHGKELLEILNQ